MENTFFVNEKLNCSSDGRKSLAGWGKHSLQILLLFFAGFTQMKKRHSS
jgi:hypothetical protein